MASATPLISVIMPVFNAGIFLRPALDAVLAQTCGDFELLLVDDGGTDGSGDAIRTERDPRVRVLDHGPGRPNCGIAASRNRGLAAARGEFIAFLNHDDACRPERFARQLEFFRTQPEVGLLGTAIANIGPADETLNEQKFPTEHLGIRWQGLLDCPVRQSAMMARRRCFADLGLRYDESFVSNSDYEFIERMTRVVPSANLPEVLTFYRKHETNASKLRYGMFVDAGARIALAAIRHELPGFAVELAEVACVRSTVLGYVPPGATRSVADMERGWDVYLALQRAFRDKHRDHPAFAAPSVTSAP